MNHKLRIAGYVVVLATLVGVLLTGPAAWATPGQSPDNQTVPTRTSAPPPEPTSGGDGGGEGEPSSDTPAPPAAATPAPSGTPLPTTTPVAVPTQGARLLLEKRADRDQAWPGVPVRYTLILSNPGATSARQVLIEDPLPPGLLPGAILQGAGAAWSGRTLRAQVPALPPGGKYTLAFTALVGPDAVGPALLNRASASGAGGLTARASLSLALPPSELPPVGGNPSRAARGEATGH